MAIASEIYEFGEYVLDVANRKLTKSTPREDIHLTRGEFDFLTFLIRDKVATQGRPISRKELRAQFWGRDDDQTDGNLRELYGRVREKLGDTGADLQRHINTEIDGYVRFARDVSFGSSGR